MEKGKKLNLGKVQTHMFASTPPFQPLALVHGFLIPIQ
jgi:hypothetical protein